MAHESDIDWDFLWMKLSERFVLGSALGAAAVFALVAQFGGMPKLQPLVGLIVILSIAYTLSTNRRAIDGRTVAWGLGLQIVFALLVLKTAAGQRVFETLGATINHLLGFAFVGSSFVFGPLGDKVVWPRIMNQVLGSEGARYGVVSHLLSLAHNRRLRVRTFAPDDDFPVVPSVIDIWPSVNWFEREAFDLYGIMFPGHPDLRRLLTDYGFVGHPFRKDFPLSGYVEMRYDPEQARVIYQPVTIEPREVTPRVVREENYAENE